MARVLGGEARTLVCGSRGRVHPGLCPICGPTVFTITGSWLRDNYFCLRCRSIPRQRALIHFLNVACPDWRDRETLEASPGSVSSQYIASSCSRYTPSQLFPDVAAGEYRDGVRREDLEHLTYPDGSLDLVITQDVLEHVLNPWAAFSEIHRVLRSDGVHVWTVPIYDRPTTVVRARLDADGQLEHLLPPDYHGNPLGGGSLVVREWGNDIVEHVDASAPTSTTRYRTNSWLRGVRGEMADVLITRRVTGHLPLGESRTILSSTIRR